MSTPNQLDRPAGVREHRLGVSGGPLAVLELAPRDDEARDTPRSPVVLVPGYTGSKEDFLPLLEPLAGAGFRVLAFDQRGQHESPGSAEVSAYQVEALAGELLELLGWVGGPAHVVGHSFGGLVGRAAAVAEPAALRSLTLLDSGPGTLGGERAALIRELEPVLVEHGQQAVWQVMSRLPNGRPQPAAVQEFVRRRFFASHPVGLRGMGNALLAEPDRIAELCATGLPVLVAHGEHDDAWPPAEQAEMARRLGARHAVIPGAVHSPNVEAPGVTAEVLGAFFRDVEAG